MKTKSKTSIKRVRAWAVLSTLRPEKIALGLNDYSYKIFPHEDVAEVDNISYGMKVQVVPCTISYTPPKKHK